MKINSVLILEDRDNTMEILLEYKNLLANQLKHQEGTDTVTHAIELVDNAKLVYCPGMQKWAPVEF